MSSAKVAHLTDRGVVAIGGADAVDFLQNLVTNDLSQLAGGDAVHAGLLSPQGKILFEFFAVAPGGEDILLDVARDKARDLVKRLQMYKLRARIDIADASDRWDVWATIGADDASAPPIPSGDSSDRIVNFTDPRHLAMGKRWLVPATGRTQFSGLFDARIVDATAYDAHRVALGVPEGGKDYAFGDTYPHEADFDLFNGVSFSKGCYVGQEIVARMQNKSVVRKRVIKIGGASDLPPGIDVLLGETSIGRIGTVSGSSALAMLRLDRALEAREKSIALIAGGIIITPDADAIERYAASSARAPASNLSS